MFLARHGRMEIRRMKTQEQKKRYCPKHDQYWMEHVSSCPICAGEKMTLPAQPKDLKSVKQMNNNKT